MSKVWLFPLRIMHSSGKEGEEWGSKREEKLREELELWDSHIPLPYRHPPWSFCSFLWKPTFFLGVLSSLVYLFLLPGAPPWRPPKCLLQIFIFINVAYTRAGDRERGEPERFTNALWHSAPEIISAGGYPGRSALIPRPPIPISKQNCNSYLQSEAPYSAEPKASFPEKPMMDSSIPSSPLTRMLSCLIQRNSQALGPEGDL